MITDQEKVQEYANWLEQKSPCASEAHFKFVHMFMSPPDSSLKKCYKEHPIIKCHCDSCS